MSWTDPPKTWSPGETVTANMLNTHLRDQLNVLSSARAIFVTIGGPGSVIAAGSLTPLPIPFDLEILGWTLLSGFGACSIVIDVWKDTFANYPPTVADTITGSEKPTLSSAEAAQDSDLSTWTTEVSAGDILFFNVDSASGAEQVTLTLPVRVR